MGALKVLEELREVFELEEAVTATVKNLKPDNFSVSKPNIVARVQAGKHLWQISLSPNGLISSKLLKGAVKTSTGTEFAAVKAFKQAWKSSQYYSMYPDYMRVKEDLDEATAQRTKRRKAGKGSKKTSKTCPDGYHQVDGKCKKVTGTQKSRQQRLKKKWSKSGKGKRSGKKTKRLSKMYGSANESRPCMDCLINALMEETNAL